MSSRLGTTYGAKESSFVSESSPVVVFIPPSFSAKPMSTFSAFLYTSVTVLEQASRRYLRVYVCKSTTLVLASNETLNLKPVLNGILPSLLTHPPYNVCRGNYAKHSAFGDLSVSEKKQKAKLVTNLLHLSGHVAGFFTPQQSAS